MKKILFAIFVIIALLGCSNNVEKRSDIYSENEEINKRSETNIFSNFEKEEIKKSQTIGSYIYSTDQVSGVASDNFIRLVESGKIEKNGTVKGWLTYYEKNYIECIFISENKDKRPYINYKYQYNIKDKKEKNIVLKNKEYLKGNLLSMYKARQLALNSGIELVAENYNPVVLKIKEGILVYLLAATNKRNTYVLGGVYGKMKISRIAR